MFLCVKKIIELNRWYELDHTQEKNNKMYQTGNVDNFSDMNDKIIDENNEEYIKTKGAFIPYENLNNLTPRQKVLLWTLYFDCNLF